MRFSIYIVFIVFFICLNQPESLAQEVDPGIGMVILPGGDHGHGVVFAKPDSLSDTVATVFEWQYTFYPSKEEARGFLTGFDKYDSWGLPILSFNSDSSWAEVSLETYSSALKAQGWVNLRIPGTMFRIWADFLPRRSMVLRRDRPIRFYSKPDKDSVLNVKLFKYPDRDEYSYILRPIRREGRWLLVELQAPISPCGNGQAEIEHLYGVRTTSIRVWIEYIDERGRPLVMAGLMC
jgi:hypothetical protein